MKRRKGLESLGDRVHGQLLQWAREQQDLTMRWINDHGGPSLGYQSEVERGIKQEVSSEVLASWVKLLGVTPAFARGQVPRHREDPAACAGLAYAVALSVVDGREDHPDWRALSPEERMREIIRRIPRDCPALPRVVLAYVLDLSLPTLDAIMLGSHPILREPAQALTNLVPLPDAFWQRGEVEAPAETERLHRYADAVRLAEAKGITPEEMLTWVRRRRRAGE